MTETFSELVSKRGADFNYEEELATRIKAAKELLAQNKNATIPPYKLVITVTGRDWRSVVWNMACALDSCMRGPKGARAAQGGNGGGYSMALSHGDDAQLCGED